MGARYGKARQALERLACHAARTVDDLSKTSTIIDMSLTDIGSDVSGTIAVFGVTGMTANDFVY
jgi:hypothetical protein